MNKLLTKIVGVALGASMAIGVGVAVVTNSGEAKVAKAAESTYQKVTSLAANKNVLIVSHSSSGQYYLMDATTAATSAGPKYITCSLSNSKITGDYDSHLFTVSASSTNWKFATGSKYLKWSSTSSNTAVRINTGDSDNTWTYSNGTMKFSSATRYLGVYTAGSDWRSYNSSTAGNYSGTGANIEFYEKVASTPTITPGKSSTSGYTGGSETLSFTYSNLTGSLGVVSSDASIVTVDTPSTSGSSGTVKINFVGAGSTTVKFKDGSTELASVDVTVAAASVTITGLPSTSTAYIDRNLDLGSLITVTATGSYSSDVTWESDDDDIATVTAAGVVTGVAEGEVGITVTSDDYPSATMTCTVTVSEAPLEYQVIFGTDEGSGQMTSFSNTSFVIPSEVTLNNIQGNLYTNNSNQAASIRFGKSGTTGSFDASITGNYYIASVKCNLKYYGSDTTATFAVTPDGGSAISKSLTGSWADYTYDVSAAKAKKVTLGTDVNGKRAFLSGFTITYAPFKTLSNIALSGTYPTTFTKGDAFSHSGMVVTANYSDSTSAIVTNSATWSSPDMSTPGVKTVTVSYSDECGSATKNYSITVNYAAPTSVVLSSSSATVALEETFDVSTLTVTINPSATADQTAFAWSVYDDGDLVEDVDYVWIAPEILSYKAGTFVLRCTSTEDGSKYADFTLTVSGDPIVHLLDGELVDVTDGSATVFGDAGTLTYGVTTENFEGTMSYAWSTSNSSIISIDDDQGDMCDFYVEGVGGSARLSCRVRGSTKGDVTVYIDVTVTAVTVTSVTWTAPTINVYSGATLSSTSGWNVKYSTNSGKTDQTPDSFKVMLGGSEISLPYEWKASDDGKALGVQVGGTNSSTTNVSVTQSLRPVYAPTTDTNTVSWTATEAANLGSQISSQGGTDEGTISTGDYSWNYTRTLTSLASGKSDNISFQGTTWIQLGSNNSMESIEFTTSAIPGTIKSVSVVAATAGSHVLTIDVGGTKYLEDESLHVYTGTAAADNPDPDECVKTGTGSSSGAITITIAPTAATRKAMVIRSISVTYETGSSEKVNIANIAGHEAAQKAVVKFAKAFNAAMDTTSGCTTNMSSAWSTASSAWETFLSEAAALGTAEEAYAKKLVQNATAQWTDDTDSDYEYCLERAMATYEWCVSHYSGTCNPFMTPVRTLPSNSSHISGYLSGINSSNVYAIAITMSMITFAVVGGYFFLRKKKEEK